MDNCIFCLIIDGVIPSRRVYEDDVCIATLDIGPATPGHTLILPKKHYDDLLEMDEATAGHLMMVAKKIGALQMERLGAAGFNVVQNNREAAGQTVKHFHIHVIPRYDDGNVLVSWVPTEPSGEELDAVLAKLTDPCRS